MYTTRSLTINDINYLGGSMIKVIGFSKKIAGKTNKEYLGSPAFCEACLKTARILKIEDTILRTKRQASKFSRGKGLVYETTVK